MNLPDEIEVTVKIPTQELLEVLNVPNDRGTSHEYRIDVARRYAEWHLGDPNWANRFLDVYRFPHRTQRELDKEMRDATSTDPDDAADRGDGVSTENFGNPSP